MCSAPRQSRESAVIAPDQRLFLLAPPTLDLPFGRNRVFDAGEFLMKNEDNGPTTRGVAVEAAVLMLGDPLLEAGAGRADII